MEQSFSYLSHILSILVLSCVILSVFCIILHDFAIRCRIWQLVGLDGVLGLSWPSESHGVRHPVVREVSDTCRCSGTSASCHKLSAVSGLSTLGIVGLRIAGVFGSIQALYGTLIIFNHF